MAPAAELLEFLGECISEHKLALFREASSQRTRHVQVVLDSLEDPLDANAALRSCECFGIQAVHWVQPPQGKRVSRGVAVGSSKWLELKTYPTGCKTLTANLRHQGLRQFALSTRESALSIEDMPLEQPFALWCASEDTGLPAATARGVDGFVRLPMVGLGTHFNFSVTVALALKRITDRLRNSVIPWALNPAERQNLLLEWCATVPKRRRDLVQRFLDQTPYTLADLAPPATSQRFWDMIRPVEEDSAANWQTTP